MKTKYNIDGIIVEGPKHFINWTRTALLLIKNKDPPSYNYLIKYICRIVLRKNNSRILPESGIFYVGRITAFPYKKSTSSLVWYASVLIHETAHVELFKSGKICNNKKAEVYSIKKQINVLKKLEDKYQFIKYLNEEMINVKKSFKLTSYHPW